MRLILYLIIFAAIYYGVRKIITDWRDRYKELDEQKHQRDLKERDRGDVIDLSPDEDGVYRPDDDEK